MNRIKSAVALWFLALPGFALAQANDPAVASCEMLVREELPNTTAYRYLSAEIAGSVVILGYETREDGAAAVKRQKRCAFAFNASTGSWGFAPGLPDSLSVAVMGALAHRGIYPIPGSETVLKP